jgi:hypothetical protein
MDDDDDDEQVAGKKKRGSHKNKLKKSQKLLQEKMEKGIKLIEEFLKLLYHDVPAVESSQSDGGGIFIASDDDEVNLMNMFMELVKENIFVDISTFNFVDDGDDHDDSDDGDDDDDDDDFKKWLKSALDPKTAHPVKAYL